MYYLVYKEKLQKTQNVLQTVERFLQFVFVSDLR